MNAKHNHQIIWDCNILYWGTNFCFPDLLQSQSFPQTLSRNGLFSQLMLCRLLSHLGPSPCEELFENVHDNLQFLSNLGISKEKADFRWNHGSLEFICDVCSKAMSRLDCLCWLCWLTFQFRYSRISWFDLKFLHLWQVNFFAKDTKPELWQQLCDLKVETWVFLLKYPRYWQNYHYFLRLSHMDHASIHKLLLYVQGIWWQLNCGIDNHVLRF